MSGTDIAAIIGALSLLVTSIGSFVIGVMSLRLQRMTQTKVEEVRHATNSMKDELVASTAIASEAKGRDDERANPTGPPSAGR